MKLEKGTAQLRRKNVLFVRKLLLNVLSLIVHFVTHIHPLLLINTSELPSTASLCVVVDDEGHSKASLQQLFGDRVPFSRNAQS